MELEIDGDESDHAAVTLPIEEFVGLLRGDLHVGNPHVLDKTRIVKWHLSGSRVPLCAGQEGRVLDHVVLDL